MHENQVRSKTIKHTPSVSASSSLRPTKKQQEILEYIEEFIEEHGYSPSYREIMNGLQYTSVATVALHVRNLIARGHLRKRDRSARSLEVVRSDRQTGAEPVQPLTGDANGEQWLLAEVEQLFARAENNVAPDTAQLVILRSVVTTLSALGLDTAAQRFNARLAGVRQGIDD